MPHHMDEADIAAAYGDLSGFTISRDAHEALRRSRFGFICSGTATLEAALIGTPLVLAYRAKWLDFQIASHFVKLPFVGLGNLIAHFENRPPLFEELLQEAVTPENLLRACREADVEQFLTRSRELRALLAGKEAELADRIIRLASHQ